MSIYNQHGHEIHCEEEGREANLIQSLLAFNGGSAICEEENDLVRVRARVARHIHDNPPQSFHQVGVVALPNEAVNFL